MCINSHNFLRPIASVAFNERADELAVAAGHKVHCVAAVGIARCQPSEQSSQVLLMSHGACAEPVQA